MLPRQEVVKQYEM